MWGLQSLRLVKQVCEVSFFMFLRQRMLVVFCWFEWYQILSDWLVVFVFSVQFDSERLFLMLMRWLMSLVLLFVLFLYRYWLMMLFIECLMRIVLSGLLVSVVLRCLWMNLVCCGIVVGDLVYVDLLQLGRFYEKRWKGVRCGLFQMCLKYRFDLLSLCMKMMLVCGFLELQWW